MEEEQPKPLTLWAADKGNWAAKGRVQHWPCNLYANWSTPTSDGGFIRINQGYAKNEFLMLPRYADDIAALPICMRCSNQFNCLAGNVKPVTSRMLALP